MSGCLVEVEGLTRRFERSTALEQVDFRARMGFVHGLVGANGAGKTILLRHLGRRRSSRTRSWLRSARGDVG